MTLPAALFAVRCLIRDTFRQSLSSGIFWLMLGFSAIAFGVCLSVDTVDLPLKPTDSSIPERIPKAEAIKRADDTSLGMVGGAGLAQGKKHFRDDTSVDVIDGKLTFGFGAFPIPWSQYREDTIRWVQLLLLSFIAGTVGILLALIWTAGFLPTFLEPSAAAVLLAKPVPRWSLLAGKYLGVLVFVAFHAVVFVGGVWLALGMKTGVWDATCFLAIPVLLLHFAVFFSFSALLAVTTRSTVACVFGSLLFWLICLAMNLARHSAYTLPGMPALPAMLSFLIDVGYWVLPKPADLGFLLIGALGAEGDFPQAFDIAELQRKNLWHPGVSLFASGLFALFILSVAAYEFVTTDY